MSEKYFKVIPIHNAYVDKARIIEILINRPEIVHKIMDELQPIFLKEVEKFYNLRTEQLKIFGIGDLNI